MVSDVNLHPYREMEFASPLQRRLECKSPQQLEGMRAACSLGRAVIDAVARAIAPGVTTDELDRICHNMTVANGAYPSPLNYMGFPKSICTSVRTVQADPGLRAPSFIKL